MHAKQELSQGSRSLFESLGEVGHQVEQDVFIWSQGLAFHYSNLLEALSGIEQGTKDKLLQDIWTNVAEKAPAAIKEKVGLSDPVRRLPTRFRDAAVGLLRLCRLLLGAVRPVPSGSRAAGTETEGRLRASVPRGVRGCRKTLPLPSGEGTCCQRFPQSLLALLLRAGHSEQIRVDLGDDVGGF